MAEMWRAGRFATALLLFAVLSAQVRAHRHLLQEEVTPAQAAEATADVSAVADAPQQELERVPGPLHLDPTQQGKGPGGFYR